MFNQELKETVLMTILAAMSLVMALVTLTIISPGWL
jgi:hypothetical protein